MRPGAAPVRAKECPIPLGRPTSPSETWQPVSLQEGGARHGRRRGAPHLRSLRWGAPRNPQRGVPFQLAAGVPFCLAAARKLVLAADGGYATHDFARFAMRHRDRVTFVSRFYPDANLYRPPPARRNPRRPGRPACKGRKLLSPRKAVAKSKRTRWSVGWYGGGTRLVEGVSDVGWWYRAGAGLVPLRWVFVRDLTGTHRDEYFFSSDPGMTPEEIVGCYTGRWNLETTFQEMRSCLGLQTTRCRKKDAILRVAPCLFGLYSFVAILYSTFPDSVSSRALVAWAGKRHITFSDAITAVRRWLWRRWIFETGHKQRAFSKIPGPLRRLILCALAPAA